jgi:hypothetical protein
VRGRRRVQFARAGARRVIVSALRPLTWLSIVLAAFVGSAMFTQNLWAWEFDEATSADGSVSDRRSIAFHATGTVHVTSMPCGPDTCFSFTGGGMANGRQITVTGEGTLSNCVTGSTATKCDASGTQTVVVRGVGSVDFSFTGSSSQKIGSIKETLSARLTATGGTGQLSGAAGGGRETVTDRTTTGKGTFVANGSLH